MRVYAKQASARTLPRHARKTPPPIVKYFGSSAGKSNQHGPAPFHRRRLWFNAYPTYADRALIALETLHCRLCVALKSSLRIYSPLSLNIVRQWRRCGRQRHSKRHTAHLDTPEYLTDTIETSNIQNWLISLLYDVKENARWKCQPFSRARGIAFASYQRISPRNRIWLFTADGYSGIFSCVFLFLLSFSCRLFYAYDFSAYVWKHKRFFYGNRNRVSKFWKIIVWLKMFSHSLSFFL